MLLPSPKDPNEYDPNEYDLNAVSGDCRESVSDSDKTQLLANMNKTVAEVAIKNNKLFKNMAYSIWTID